MPTPPRKATPRKKQAKVETFTDLIGEQSTLDAMRDEVAAEPEGTAPAYSPVPFLGRTVRIADFLDWPAIANDLLSSGHFIQGLGQILHRDDFVNIVAPANPTNRQIIEFFTDAEKVTGLPFGLLLTSLSR